MSLDLATPIREALLDYVPVASELPVYNASKPIFTRRPVPDDAPYPLIMVSPDIAITHVDGIVDQRPIVIRDVSVYGANDTPENYRAVERIAYAVKELFHDNRYSIAPEGWDVISVMTTGPRPAPNDDQKVVGRLVELSIRLARKNPA